MTLSHFSYYYCTVTVYSETIDSGIYKKRFVFYYRRRTRVFVTFRSTYINRANKHSSSTEILGEKKKKC